MDYDRLRELRRVDCARQQHASAWELRTATSLARLRSSQGRHQEAHQVLLGVCRTFTEGFETRDLKAADELLKEVGMGRRHRQARGPRGCNQAHGHEEVRVADEDHQSREHADDHVVANAPVGSGVEAFEQRRAQSE